MGTAICIIIGLVVVVCMMIPETPKEREVVRRFRKQQRDDLLRTTPVELSPPPELNVRPAPLRPPT